MAKNLGKKSGPISLKEANGSFTCTFKGKDSVPITQTGDSAEAAFDAILEAVGRRFKNNSALWEKIQRQLDTAAAFYDLH